MNTVIEKPGIRSSNNDSRRLVVEKYGGQPSAYIAARLKAGYFSPEDQYEALLDRLVTPEVAWLDIGCGRAPFPNNLGLSERLAQRCQLFVGIDPDASVADNKYVHERRQATLEQYFPIQGFDLITARMVVEHVERPTDFAAALARVANPQSLVVLFTVNWWSTTALAAYCSPMAIHHWIKRKLWRTQEQDTFATSYRMNRRSTLTRLMKNAGFDERRFNVLPDASLFWQFPRLRRAELACFRATRRLGLPYLDSNILGVYQRVA